MKKILILGSNSFSGNHLVDFLIKKKFQVIGCSQSNLSPRRFNPLNSVNSQKFKFYKLNINKDFPKLEKIIIKYKPSIIIDFLGQGMVAESWAYPHLTFKSNVLSKRSILLYVVSTTLIKGLLFILK